MITTEKLKSILERTGHHPLGPSSAARWMTCPGSVLATIDLPDTTTSYAQEGTEAHAMAEDCLKSGTDAPDGEMGEYVQQYLDYVRELADGQKLFVEQMVKLTHLYPQGAGTIDCVFWRDKELHVIDLKYGMNKVSADGPQLRIYASGVVNALKKLDVHFESIHLHIFQPRNGGANTHVITPGELADFENEVRKAAKLCLKDDAPLNPSEKACEWCKAKASCVALYDHQVAVVGSDFDVLPSANSLTDEQLKLVLDNKVLLEKWLKAVEAEVYGRFEHGDGFDGYKVVHGRSIRKWTDDAEGVLGKLLGDEAYEKKLVGITKAEKVLGKKHLEELGITHKPEGKPVLVPDSDKRPAIALIADDFSEL